MDCDGYNRKNLRRVQMIRYYQELLNECIDLQENNEQLDEMKEILEIMKGGLERCQNQK